MSKRALEGTETVKKNKLETGEEECFKCKRNMKSCKKQWGQWMCSRCRKSFTDPKYNVFQKPCEGCGNHNFSTSALIVEEMWFCYPCQRKKPEFAEKETCVNCFARVSDRSFKFGRYPQCHYCSNSGISQRNWISQEGTQLTLNRLDSRNKTQTCSLEGVVTNMDAYRKLIALTMVSDAMLPLSNKLPEVERVIQDAADTILVEYNNETKVTPCCRICSSEEVVEADFCFYYCKKHTAFKNIENTPVYRG